jgi:hypothetical protein
MILGPIFTRNASGALPEGRFEAKMIVVESLWDREALPWQADWYREKVRQHLGSRTDDCFRLWYTDRALHGAEIRQQDETRTVTYQPVLQQALRDVAAWAEKGIAPPATTGYRVEDGQVIVAPTARERRGIQPLVSLQANGAARADVAAGQTVQFTGTIEVPPGTGSVVRAEWDFEGKGDFPVASELTDERAKVSVRASHAFARPGTYFVALRGSSQRSGDATTPFARIRNLARARVVVK